MTLLHIRISEASYDAIPVLHDIDLQIDEGAFIAVIGANTAGKSTLLKAVSGLMPNVKGTISLLGENLLSLPAHEIPTRGVAHVPEGRHVFPLMSVEENLWLGGYCHRHDEAGLKTTLEKIYVMFPRLLERAKQLAGTLSGGEQQMVAIGRALMGKPKLLLLDEPSHGLAPKIVKELHDAFLEIHKSGVTTLLVEQNTKLALSVASDALVLQAGHIVLKGKSSELLHDPRIREAYLGI